MAQLGHTAGARVVISQWLVQCNTVRPHRGSGCCAGGLCGKLQ